MTRAPAWPAAFEDERGPKALAALRHLSSEERAPPPRAAGELFGDPAGTDTVLANERTAASPPSRWPLPTARTAPLSSDRGRDRASRFGLGAPGVGLHFVGDWKLPVASLEPGGVEPPIRRGLPCDATNRRPREACPQRRYRPRPACVGCAPANAATHVGLSRAVGRVHDPTRSSRARSPSLLPHLLPGGDSLIAPHPDAACDVFERIRSVDMHGLSQTPPRHDRERVTVHGSAPRAAPTGPADGVRGQHPAAEPTLLTTCVTRPRAGRPPGEAFAESWL